MKQTTSGEINSSLIAPYVNEFGALLTHKNNRLQWGAMTALCCITLENPKAIYDEVGSVITKDCAVNVLIKLCTVKQYADSAFSLLNEQLLNSPTNQLLMYAERALPVINGKTKGLFIKTLISRLDDIEKDAKRKRVEKIIQKLNKL